MSPRRVRDSASVPGFWHDLDGAGAIIRDVDRVELKFMIADVDRDRLMAVLRVDPARTQCRQAWFLDTNRLALARRGVVVRARRTRGGRADLVVKLRRSEPVRLPVWLRRSPNLSVEADALPGLSVWTAALARRVRHASMAAVIDGREVPAVLLSAELRRLVREPTGKPVALADLCILGPVEITRARTGSAVAGPKMVLESWAFPDGSRLLEVSTKCSPARAVRVAARMGAFLVEHGVELGAVQDTKSWTSLEYFTGQVRLAGHP